MERWHNPHQPALPWSYLQLLTQFHLNFKRLIWLQGKSEVSCKHRQKSEDFVFDQQMTTWTLLLERDRAAKLFSRKGKYIRGWRTPFGEGYFQDQRPDPMSGCRQVGLALVGTPAVKQNWIPPFICILLLYLYSAYSQNHRRGAFISK